MCQSEKCRAKNKLNQQRRYWARELERHWISPSQARHRWGAPMLGEANPSAKLTEAQVRQILTDAQRFTKTALARQFGVDRSLIRLIVERKVWRHVA